MIQHFVLYDSKAHPLWCGCQLERQMLLLLPLGTSTSSQQQPKKQINTPHVCWLAERVGGGVGNREEGRHGEREWHVLSQSLRGWERCLSVYYGVGSERWWWWNFLHCINLCISWKYSITDIKACGGKSGKYIDILDIVSLEQYTFNLFISSTPKMDADLIVSPFYYLKALNATTCNRWTMENVVLPR